MFSRHTIDVLRRCILVSFYSPTVKKARQRRLCLFYVGYTALRPIGSYRINNDIFKVIHCKYYVKFDLSYISLVVQQLRIFHLAS